MEMPNALGLKHMPTIEEAVALLNADKIDGLDVSIPGWTKEMCLVTLMNIARLNKYAAPEFLELMFCIGYELGYKTERAGWDTDLRPYVVGEE